VTSPAPLRVLLVADFDDDPRLGSAKVAHKLRDELRAAGHHCDALFSEGIGRSPANRQVRQLVAPVLAMRAIRRASATVPYDIIDAASAEGLWFGVRSRLRSARRPALICRSNGLEHRNYQRMLDDSRAALLAKPVTRRLWYPASRLSQVAAAARVADRLLVLNEADRQFAVGRKWQPSSRVDVVPHGVSDRFLSVAEPISARGAGMLFCGSWDLMKGTTYLVSAFDRLAQDGNPIRLTILGPGVPADRVLEAFSAAARPFVTVIDRAAEERVIAEYRRHDALVFPSTYEGFGLVALEAMSQGLPVIATPVGCIPDLLRDQGNGLLVPCRDSSALAAAIRRLSEAPAERARFGAAAAATVAEMSWRRTAERTVDVYRRALAQVRS
jgi:glycosyltransferase involved in cell wall biosynthesis